MGLGEIPNRRKRNRKAAVIGLVAAGAVLAAALLFNGVLINFSFGLHGSELIMLGSEKLSTADAYVLLCDAKKEYESVFSDEVWNTKIGEYDAKEYVREQLKVKMLRLCSIANIAKKRGVVLQRDARNNVSRAAEKYLSGLTDEQIELMGVTDEQLVNLFEKYAIAKQLYADITGELTVEVSADEARVISIQYIVTEKEEDADEALDRFKAGENFAVLVREYGGSVSGNTNVKRKQMLSEFEEAAFDLKAGETSNVVSAGGKYYIIKCVSDNEKSLSDANKLALINEKKLEKFNEVIDSYEAGAFVEFSQGRWDKITIESVPDLGISFEDIFSEFF